MERSLQNDARSTAPSALAGDPVQMHDDSSTPWDGCFDLSDEVATDVIEPRRSLGEEVATERVVPLATREGLDLGVDPLPSAHGTATERGTEPGSIEEEASRIHGAALRFLAEAPEPAVVASNRQARAVAVDRANAHLDEVIYAEMNLRLQDAQWYLTGVQVGLASLHQLYEISSLVYRPEEEHSVGARKVENLRVVHERLVEFERCFQEGADPTRRASILLGNRDRFETLLEDLEERTPERKAALDPNALSLSLYEQVARDVHRVVNQLRAYENLVGALKRIEQAPRFPPGARSKKIAEFVTSYGSILSLLDWEDTEHFKSAAEVREKQALVREHIAGIRAHLARVRRALLGAEDRAADDDARPERDLDPERVVPVLRKVSEHGVAYLKRAYGVYEHAVQRSDLVGRLRSYLDATDLT